MSRDVCGVCMELVGDDGCICGESGGPEPRLRPMVSFTKTEARALRVLLEHYVAGYHYRSQSPAFLATLHRIRTKIDAFVPTKGKP